MWVPLSVLCVGYFVASLWSLCSRGFIFGDKALVFVFCVVGFAFFTSALLRAHGRAIHLPLSGGWGVARYVVGFAYSSCARAFGWERVVLHVIRIRIRFRWWWSVVVCRGLLSAWKADIGIFRICLCSWVLRSGCRLLRVCSWFYSPFSARLTRYFVPSIVT